MEYIFICSVTMDWKKSLYKTGAIQSILAAMAMPKAKLRAMKLAQ